MSCPSLETAAAWVLDELPPDEAERFEEHYFGCSRCFEHASALTKLVERLRTSVPAVMTRQRHDALSAHRRMASVHVEPGANGRIRLGPETSVGVWIMHAPLEGVTRVDIEGREPDGRVAFALADVPFDAERGQVLLACQLHYRALGADPKLFVALRASDATGSRELGTYILDHEFDSV